MAFEFDHDETIDEAATRIAHEQLGAALAWLDVAAGDDDPDDGRGDEPGDGGAAQGPTVAAYLADGRGSSADERDEDDPVADAVAAFVADEIDDDDSVEEAVHEARKCCKRVRGLVRLVRPAMEDDYQAINTAARDAARELSPIRDAHALLATFDDLVAARADQVPGEGVAGVRAQLAARAEAATEAVTTNHERIERARALLLEARGGVETWALADLDRDAQLDAMVDGIAKTAGRARDRFDEAVEVPGPPADEVLHQWRKRVKYSWYHVSLLEPAAPTLLGELADFYHDLSDVLGDDHDLAVLSAALRDAPEEFGGAEEVEAALVLLDGTRRDLQRRAIGVGARLHAERPRALGRRLVALLAAWWAHGPEPSAGEIADLHDAADDLGDRTNAQLRELARERDLPGRSRLDRAGLLAALRAGGPTA